MSNDSKRVSELTQATTLSANDRVVVLTNPNSAANAQTIKLSDFGVTLANNAIPIANSTQLGVIKIGDGLAIAANGTVTAPLPIASKTITGVVKVGENINVDANGVISIGNLIPPAGGSTGYVFTSDALGNGHWQAFSGVYNATMLNTYGSNTYVVTSNDTIIFADPNAVGSDVRIILPIADAIEGKEIVIKNIEPGYSGYKVIVTTDRPSFSYIESPVTGEMGIKFDIIDRGQTETWIHDGSLYRHLATARAIPIFYTDANTYAQVVIKNASGGENASADLVLYNDIADEAGGSGPFIDMGINGSNYSNATYSIGGPNDAYIFTDNVTNPGGNLAIGTAQDRSIVFHANGTTSDKSVFVINSTSVATSVNIIPETNNVSLGNSSHIWNTVYANTIAVPNGSLITSTLTVSPVINNANLDHIVAYSTDATSIPIGTYGNESEIQAPWAVYQLTAVPSPALQVNDLVAGTGVPLNNYIRYVGHDAYANLIIADKTFTIVPENDTLLTITRDVINPSFSITTIANTNIALTPGSNGIIIVNSDIVPATTNANRLGTPAKRFKELWLGPGTLYVADETLGVDQAIGAKDGNFYIKGGAGFNVGEFTLRDNRIAITDPNREILFGTDLATGNVVFSRPIIVKSYDTGLPTFTVTRDGQVKVITPNIGSNDQAFSITGSSDGATQSTGLAGRMIHITGNDGLPSRIENDAFGTGVFPAYIGRSGRGTANTPTASQSGDVISRIAALGWGDTGFLATNIGSGPPINSIDFVASENYTDTNAGSKINFYTSPVGARARTLSLTVAANGVMFPDNSVQNTAFNSTSAVTSISVGTGLTRSSATGAVGIDTTAVLSVVGTANQVSVANVGGTYTLSLPQSIGTNSTVQFNTLTVQNLNVTGGTTTANTLSIVDKVIHLAPNTTLSSQIAGGGITLGNTDASYHVSFLYDLDHTRWDTDGAGLKTLDLLASNVTANSGMFSDQLHAGAAYLGYDFPNATFQGDCNTPSYNQVVMKNHSGSTQASADIVAVNDIGTDSANYIDMGINSSTYANNDYSMGGPNDGYLYVNGGNLDIATQTTGKVIQFYIGNTTTDALRATINASGLAVVGNISATYINGTVTGTANSADYIGTLPAANVVSNSQLQANLAGYQTTAGLSANVAALGYQTTAGLSANVAKLTANLATYVIANTGIVSNASGVFVNSAYITSLVTPTDLSGYQTIAGLAANVATLTSNNTSFVGNVAATNVVSNAQLTANLANYALNSVLNSYQTTTGLASNVATLTANNTTFVGTVTAANVVSNAQLVANLANYQAIAGMTSYQTTAGLASNVATLVANNTSFVGLVTAANVVSNAQLQSNLANYVTTSVAANYVNTSQLSSNLSNYQTLAGLGANVAGLTANNTYFVGTVSAANVVSNAQLQSNLSNYTTTTSLSSNLANYALLAGASFTNNISVANTLTVAKLSANGSVGAAGQILASNGTTTYWITPSAASVNTAAQYSWTNTQTFSNTISFTGIANVNTIHASGVSGTNGQVLVANSADGMYWADLKTHKKKKVKHKDGTYEPDVDAVSLQDTITFIDGTGIVMVSNTTNETITINVQNNIRDVGAVNSVVIDFATDEIILIQPTNSSTFTMNNYSVGKIVQVWVAPTTTKAITLSGITASHATLACTAPIPVSGQMIKMEYLSTTTANTGVYVSVNR